MRSWLVRWLAAADTSEATAVEAAEQRKEQPRVRVASSTAPFSYNGVSIPAILQFDTPGFYIAAAGFFTSSLVDSPPSRELVSSA